MRHQPNSECALTPQLQSHACELEESDHRIIDLNQAAGADLMRKGVIETGRGKACQGV